MNTAVQYSEQSSNIIPFPIKRTEKHSNTHKAISNDRPHEPVQPIKDIEDIRRAKEYFRSLPQTRENARNYMMFVVNINNAVRISDLLKIKIGDVLTENYELKDEIYIQESKTKKRRYIFLGKESKAAIMQYLSILGSAVDRNSFLFEATSSKENGRGKAISRQQAWNIMQKLSNALTQATGKEYHLGTHSMRKTFGYQKIKQHSDDPMIVAQISEMYNHSNMNTTYRYLGIDVETKKKLCTEDEL